MSSAVNRMKQDEDGSRTASTVMLAPARPALPALDDAADLDRHRAWSYRDRVAPQRLLRHRQTLLHWIQWLSSIAWVLGSLHFLTIQHLAIAPTEYRFLGVAAVMMMLVVYPWMGVFRRFGTRRVSCLRLSWAWLLVLAGLLGIAFATQANMQYSRALVGTWAVVALVGQLALFLLTQSLSNLWQRRLRVNRPALVVGSGPAALHLAESINRNPFLPDHVAGVVDDPPYRALWPASNVPFLGALTDIPKLVEEFEVDRVYLAMPIERSAEMADLQRQLFDHNVDIIWAPDISALNLLNPCVHEIAGVPLISLSESPLGYGGRAFMKSVMDVFVSVAVLFLAAPVLLVLALVIKATSKGPVIFRQARHGWDGGQFEVWKFRSMYMHDDPHGHVTQATRDDPRVTPVGRFMRRSSLDELPQLFNVLNGTMSLVGPRPHAVPHNMEYAPLINAYMARHRMKPGITGWAQVHGHRGETDNVEKMQQRVRLDLEYINNWSLRLDFWILLRTPFVLFCSTAY